MAKMRMVFYRRKVNCRFFVYQPMTHMMRMSNLTTLRSNKMNSFEIGRSALKSPFLADLTSNNSGREEYLSMSEFRRMHDFVIRMR